MPLFSIVKVSIKKSNIFKDCDFVFTPTYKKSLKTGREVKAHFLNCNTGFIQVYNALSHTIDIDYQSKLDYISEISEVHFYKISKEHKYLINIKSEMHINKHRNWIQWSTAIITAMLIAGMELQIFSEVSDFCFITLTELSALPNDTAVMGLLLTEPDINHITKVNPHWDSQHMGLQRLRSSWLTSLSCSLQSGKIMAYWWTFLSRTEWWSTLKKVQNHSQKECTQFHIVIKKWLMKPLIKCISRKRCFELHK